ncbi:metal ABC transporter substrate-binding protein [Silvanigrella aquatica]|uniref:ABC transporter substrate-binding protein n=1 Tax=Silvanigrella aquatica TaxID=1915309 RepID=A0A1L4D1D8_9BACT|nr:metal ABC transporter substrate-binding protein [Silvanigrella aquatica]APJ04019.1 hypothetical protein AXG55_08905 [Silvanigrella aquatica]
MKKFFSLSIVACVSLFGFKNISYSNEIKSSSLKIETTIPYLKDLVSKASCDSKSFQVNSIISMGNDPHTFHITPANRVAIAKADIIVLIGSGLENWLTKIKRTKNQTWLNVTESMILRKLSESEMSSHNHDHDHGHDHSHDHDHQHLEYDPHIWQSPSLTKEALLKISATLIKLKPDEKKNIESCTQDYIKNIDENIVELKKLSQSISEEKRVIATNHDALGYFAKEFGFKIYSIVGLSDESAPTAAQLKKIISQLKKDKINTVFLESTGNMRNIQTVAKEANVKIGGTLYSDSLGAKDSGAETAPDMWRTNMNTIVSALKK